MSLWASLGHDSGGASNSVSSSVGSSSSIWWLLDLQFIDKLLMCLWSCRDMAVAFRLPTEAVEEVHTSPMCCSRARTWTSDIFLRDCIWQALPVVYCVSPRLLLEVFHILSTSCFCPRSLHLEIWAYFHVPFVGCILFGQCLAGQWIHVHAHLSVASGRISSIFSVKESSDPAVDSRPALFGYFRVLQHGEVRTVGASFARCTWNLDIMFTSPLHLTVNWPLFQDCMKRIRRGPVHWHWPM